MCDEQFTSLITALNRPADNNENTGSTMKQLGDFCDFKYGRSLPEKHRQGGEFPVYGSNGIVGLHNTPLTSGPAIIIGRKGSAGALQFSDKPCCPIDTTYYVDRTCTQADLKWLFFMLQNLGLNHLNKHVAVPGLNRNDAYERELLFPPIDEQKRIAAVLDKADALRRQRQESLQLTEKLLQSVFLDMFGDPAGQPQSSLVELLKKPLRNGLSPASGGQFSGTVFTLSAITRGFFNSSARKEAVFAAQPKSAAYVDEADFLICRGNGNVKLCGQGQFPSDDAIGIIFPDTIIAASIDLKKVSKAYFATLWNQPFVRHQIEAGARTAAGIFKVNQTILENIQIPVPAYERQVEFGKIAEIITRGRLALDNSVQHADNLFSSLQQLAFRGELDLSRLVLDPADDTPHATEPAKLATKTTKPKAASSFLQAPPAIEAALKALDRTVSQGEPIPW